MKEVDLLRACYQQAKKGKAPGVDGVTKQEYGQNLESSLKDLSERLGRMAYRPKPGSRKKRPLGLPSFEDKLVQKALTRVLEQIYEADFLDCSYGYRPRKTQHQALAKLGQTIQRRKVSWVVDADIEGFFDHLNQEWLGCGSFRTGDSGAVERKMDLSYYGSGEGILGLGSWVGQNNLTRKTDRLDFWIFLLHPLQVRARGAAHRDQLAVRVARGMVSERLLPLVKAPIGVEVSAGLQRTQA